MSSYVLCIFEGQKAEPNITDNLCRNLLDEDTKTILKVSFGCNIYKLYQEVIKDEYFDTYELLVEQLAKRPDLSENDKAVLEIDDPDNISDIYLFFDYDCHCSNAKDDKLQVMLDTFNDPQDRGFICISYPMVEAVRHQKDDGFSEVLHPITDLTNYKKWTNQNADLDKRYHNWGAYTFETWFSITQCHLARANYLVNDLLALPESQVGQDVIFEKQLEKHIPNDEVAVISAFPLMLHDYYGNDLYHLLDR